MSAQNDTKDPAEVFGEALCNGMTLRDWFAGQALAGIMGPNYDWFTSGTESGSRVHEAAHFAYSLADAMLAARPSATEGSDG